MTPNEYDLNKLHVQVLGSGRPLLMLHGWNRAGLDLKPLATLLSAKRTIHLIDLPGFGSSPIPFYSSPDLSATETAWGTTEYSELMVRYLQSHGITKCDILGHSFGGRICLRIASTHCDIVDSMVLIGSHGLQLPKPLGAAIKSAVLKSIRRVLRAIDNTFNTKLYTEKFVPFFGSRDYLNAGPLRSILVKTVNEDQSENSRFVKAPTLLLWGALDTETPLAMGQRFQQLIQGSHLVALDNHGHDSFKDVGAHLCAYHIESFLRQQDESIGKGV